MARRLDGEWTNPAAPGDTGSDTYPSGNGTAGGDFVFRFRALPCDANQDGAVDIFDVAKFQVNYGADHGMMPADGDFDGNGTVDIFDVALLQAAYGRTLEPPAPMPAAAGAPVAGAPVAEGIAELPLVAAQPGHSPAQSNHMTEPFGRRVSGPSEEPSQTRHGVSCHTGHLTRSVRSTMQPLAVHHVAEKVAWASAVDEVLEAREA